MTNTTTTTSPSYTVVYDPYTHSLVSRYVKANDLHAAGSVSSSRPVRKSEVEYYEIRAAAWNLKADANAYTTQDVEPLTDVEALNRSGNFGWVVLQDGVQTRDSYATEKKALKRAAELTKDAELEAQYGTEAIKLAGADEAGFWRPNVDHVAGDTVKVYSRGKYRVGVITETTKTRARVLYTTPSNVGFFTHKWFPREP